MAFRDRSLNASGMELDDSMPATFCIVSCQIAQTWSIVDEEPTHL